MTEAERRLSALAEDVLEHSGCGAWKVNAANDLDALGRLDGFLVRTGIPDPRPRSRTGAPDHDAAPPPRPRNVDAVYEMTARFSLPAETTREGARALVHHVLEDVKAAVVINNGVVLDMGVARVGEG